MGMFDKAQVVETKKPSKKTKTEVHVDGLKTLTEIDALVKALGSVRETLDKEVKDFGFEYMYTNAGGIRPESIHGVDGDATASIELRKRSTTSALTDTEQELLEQYSLPMEKSIAAAKMFGINPKYAEDTKLLGKVEKALSGIVPDDFIVLQEEKSKTVVVDTTLDLAFKKGVPREVIHAITVMAVKPKLAVTDIGVILENVKMMLADPDNQVLKG